MSGGKRMNSTLDDRGKGYESKFAQDQQLKFKATARRNKLLGLWAAKKMGMDADEAQIYAMAIVKADLEEPGHEDVFRKIREDFDAKGVKKSDHQIRRAMDELLNEAITQIEAEAAGN
jgi:hypothetical protein